MHTNSWYLLHISALCVTLTLWCLLFHTIFTIWYNQIYQSFSFMLLHLKKFLPIPKSKSFLYVLSRSDLFIQLEWDFCVEVLFETEVLCIWIANYPAIFFWTVHCDMLSFLYVWSLFLGSNSVSLVSLSLYHYFNWIFLR